MRQVDIIDQGTLVGFNPRTEEAKQWFADNVTSEGWQWMGSTLWVDHRMAGPLIDGLAREGLVS
jgi:hypothetical protein